MIILMIHIHHETAVLPNYVSIIKYFILDILDLIQCGLVVLPAIQVMNCRQWPLLLTWFNFNPSMDK